MAFYDLNKQQRVDLVAKMHDKILKELQSGHHKKIRLFFSDQDTYIRKSAYLIFGKIYKTEESLRPGIIDVLALLFKDNDFKVRQTVVNAAGEIGMTDFNSVQSFFDNGLFDAHHSVRNAVIGSVKKMGEKNPKHFLNWAKTYLQHNDKEIRREICHGIELRGRTHPQDILPMLQQLQFDKTARVTNTLVHVLGQIAYKKGCLATVIEHLNGWENKILVKDAIDEIIDVHERYKNFTILSQKEAIAFIEKNIRL